MGRKKLPEDVVEARRRVGRAVQTARQASGLRIPELAERLGISRPYLAHIEAGRRRLTDELAVKTARALRVRKSTLTDPEQDVAA